MSSFNQVSRRAQSLEKKGQLNEAIELYERFLEEFPKNTRARIALDKLRSQGVDGGAGSTAQQRYTIANNLFAQGEYARVIAQTEKLVADVPEYVSAWNLLGMAYFHAKRPDEAERCLRKALELDNNYGVAWGNIAILLYNQRRLEESLKAFQRASYLDPENASFHNSMGGLLEILGRFDEAAQACVKAIQCKPDYSRAYNNLANILYRQKKLLSAKQGYEQALKIEPDYSVAIAPYFYVRAHICDWSPVPDELANVDTVGVAGNGVAPFAMLHHEDDPFIQRRRSENRAAENVLRGPAYAFPKPAQRPERIKIGYFSADFHNHATLSLMMGLFARHDSQKFEIHAYSYGIVKQGWRRTQLQQMVDHTWEVQGASDEDIVNHAREQGLDIAVDLKGYTQESRTSLFARRMAPIQINYVGYPGTIGGDFIDYIIADHTVIPDIYRAGYSENVIYLPDCYQPNDRERKIEENTQTRQELGLPENGFVFCSFNATYKISSHAFDIWMRLLKQVDGSVLWLLGSNDWAERNLKKEAELRGVDPDRIIFAARVKEEVHLGRQKHADLFLDTFHVNAHTTASDALWAGLPVVTKIGKQFAARVAASILKAVGLPELVTETDDAYEAVALDLALNPEKLAALREKLIANRMTCPLFDTETYTRNLEAAYEAAYDRYFAGEKPADIDIAPR